MDCCQPGRGQLRSEGESQDDVDSAWAVLPSSFSEWLGLRTHKEALDYKRPLQLRQERDEAKRYASPLSRVAKCARCALRAGNQLTERANASGVNPRSAALHRSGQNFFRRGTQAWAQEELRLRNMTSALLLIALGPRGAEHECDRATVTQTTRKFDEIFGKKIAHEPLFQAILGAGSDKIEAMNIRNKFSMQRDFVSDNRILIDCTRPRLSTLEFIVVQNKRNQQTHYLVNFGFAAEVCPDELIHYLVGKNGFAHLDPRRITVQGQDKETVEWRSAVQVQNMLTHNAEQNRKREASHAQDPRFIL